MRSPTVMISKEDALPDRPEPVITDEFHFVNNRALAGPYPKGHQIAMFAMGCFWGPERFFCNIPGIWVAFVGYSGGYTANPTYEDVKSGGTGHAEVVRIVFDPEVISYEELLKHFWEEHNPTTGMTQNEDTGTQYRSAIYYFNEQQRQAAEITKTNYQEMLKNRKLGSITTKILPNGPFYFAEDYHQAYSLKNDHRCPMKGTGVKCPIRSAGLARDKQ